MPAGRQHHHLANKACLAGAHPSRTGLIPGAARVKAGLDIPELQPSKVMGGGALEPAAAGDGDLAGFSIAAGGAEGSAIG